MIDKLPEGTVTLEVIYATLLENGEQIQRAIEKLEGERNKLDEHEQRLGTVEKQLKNISMWHTIAGAFALLAALYAGYRWWG